MLSIPNTTPALDNRRWTQRVVLVLMGLLCWRVTYLALTPLELCPDEAYYWDWSRQLDWGYYSKPPMIAWIIALSTSLCGHSEFAVRLPAALLGTIGLWPVYALGRRLYGPYVGFWTVIALAATPGTAALSLLMTIDAPFLCAWAFAVWCVWELFGGKSEVSTNTGDDREARLSEKPGFEVGWLLAAIVSTGLGLLSKQTMLALFPLTLLWLASDAHGRRHLRRPAVWCWIGGSLLFLSPVVWWNWRHGWLTVQHTREHFQSKAVSLAGHFAQSAEFWAGQFGVASPISFGLMVVLGLSALATWPRTDRRVRFLVCLSVIPLCGVLGLSCLQRVEPNWPAAFHLTAFVLLAAWGCEAWEGGLLAMIPRLWFRAGIAAGAFLVLGVYSVPFVIPASSLAGGRLDATARLRGWKALGQSVGDIRAKPGGPDDTLLIAATGRGPVSELAFYLPGQPRVYRWNPTGLVDSQHDVWGGPDGISAGEVLVVTQGDRSVPAELATAFDSLVADGTVQVSLGGSRRQVLSVWRGNGYRGWPTHGITRNIPITPDCSSEIPTKLISHSVKTAE
jgi:4-amino-4-deoxy-L-arabinose transferase-like glycosyltransferase